MAERVIATAECVAEGAAWLAGTEPRFAHALETTGPWPLRLRDGGFAALAQAIVSQQLSVASAAAIGARVEAAGLHAPQVVLAASDALLSECGLSRPKQQYLRALAAAELDFEALAGLPSDEVVRRLVAVPGIGVWTAEIYALFALGRADVFPAGDLALQEGARMLFARDRRPTEKQLRIMAEAWSPWRGVAARGLWAYYAEAKQREGIR